MANDATALPTPGPEVSPAPVSSPPDDLGLDRAFLMSMARIPLIAVAWVVAAWAASAFVESFGWYATVTELVATETGAELKTFQLNLGPLAVICVGMLLAAFIDGYAFKVPNWCTLSLVVSGWYIGLMHDFGADSIPGIGGFGSAFAGTVLGFALLFPALFIGGMGQGDVKMTMGFGSWVCAYFSFGIGGWVLWWSFAIGVLVGGVFGLVMMALRREFHKNLSNTREIVTDLQVLMTVGPEAAAKRANSRRKNWVRLPYGVPLCVGFLGYLWYRLFVVN
jgi:prepilin peptidase CpaA